jgi:GH15 family glucan-1,4-alpha-glucosidase
VAYQPIEGYGLTGNMRTAALVGTNGSIDWLCFPHFDSPSVFAAILDDDKGGRFVISPSVEQVRSKQLYWPDSNVLVTRFLSDSGVAEVTDYVPVGATAERHGRRCVIRQVRSIRGTMTLRMRCAPRLRLRPGGTLGRAGRRRGLVSLAGAGAGAGERRPRPNRRWRCLISAAFNLDRALGVQH